MTEAGRPQPLEARRYANEQIIRDGLTGHRFWGTIIVDTKDAVVKSAGRASAASNMTELKAVIDTRLRTYKNDFNSTNAQAIMNPSAERITTETTGKSTPRVKLERALGRTQQPKEPDESTLKLRRIQEVGIGQALLAHLGELVENENAPFALIQRTAALDLAQLHLAIKGQTAGQHQTFDERLRAVRMLTDAAMDLFTEPKTADDLIAEIDYLTGKTQEKALPAQSEHSFVTHINNILIKNALTPEPQKKAISS